MPHEVENHYKELLQQYVDNQKEEDLYFGQNFSREFIEKEIAPEEVISIHKSALREVLPNLPEKLWHSFDFLIEMMIHYGLAMREHSTLMRVQEELQMEMHVAAKVQDTLLKTKVPNFRGLDIGMLSIPAKQMSGDYIYFVSNDPNQASVAVADVIGKGIPAALCMSMIKFGMDSLQSENSSPRTVLDIINRIVEKSVDDSMFISMFYGQYDTISSKFLYSSAGHEPALHFKSSEGKFTELKAQGLLLGVHSNVVYEECSVDLEDGDFIVMMTDGVTESRTENGFIEENLIKTILQSVKDESAQTIADTVYTKLGQIQNFQLQDDFTIVIFKKDNKKV